MMIILFHDPKPRLSGQFQGHFEKHIILVEGGSVEVLHAQSCLVILNNTLR